jgi:hypothetical protein
MAYDVSPKTPPYIKHCMRSLSHDALLLIFGNTNNVKARPIAI